jgi:hypothetical protein
MAVCCINLSSLFLLVLVKGYVFILLKRYVSEAVLCSVGWHEVSYITVIVEVGCQCMLNIKVVGIV